MTPPYNRHAMKQHRSSASTEASRRYHDRVSRQYDGIYADRYWDFHDELTWRGVKHHLPRDMSSQCLDLGCGTGKWGLKLLKTGFPTTFLDHSASMIDETRAKVEALGAKAKKATLVVGDIVAMPDVPGDTFTLTVAMGDPLSICSDPPAAAREMFRAARPGGVVIATADSKVAAIDHFFEPADLDGLERFLQTGRTNWLTDDAKERFELTMFTPASLRKLFEKAGFEVVSIIGKPVLPVRRFKHLLADEAKFERLLRMEQELAKDESAAARSSHLQITARKPVAA